MAPAPSRDTVYSRLEQFVVGPENELAHWCVARLLQEPDAVSSPVFLYGPSGTGKSHLAGSLYYELAERYEPALLSSAERFAAELRCAIREDSLVRLRAYLRRLQLLVLDDLHQLASRYKAQAELVHTLDAIESIGGQVVIAARHAPGDLAGFDRRLVSRLAGGVAVPLALPAAGSRRVLLITFAEQAGFTLTEDAATLLADRIELGPRELRGVVQTLAAGVTGGAGDRGTTHVVSTAAARELLAQQPAARRRGLATFVRMVGRHFGVSSRVLRSADRRRSVAFARHVAMYLARDCLAFSYAQIGKFFGRRDRATVVHACRHIRQEVGRDPSIARLVGDLRDRLSLPSLDA